MAQTRTLAAWGGLGLLIAATLLLIDYGDPEYPELDQGVRVVRYMSAPRQLKRSSFMVGAENKTPSRFVEWMFSSLGAAEWPPSQNGLEFSREELKMIRSTGIPLLPENVVIVAGQPDPLKGKQVVVRADNAAGKIVVDAYLSPAEGPVLSRDWSFVPPE